MKLNQRLIRQIIIESLLPFGLFFSIAFVCQWWNGCYASSLACHPDEPAHFITGTMVYDYVHTSLFTNPMRFAEDYYSHLPKVAFGHWPPVFYVIQAAWYSVAGVSVESARILISVIISIAAWLVFRRCINPFGFMLAIQLAVFFVFLPLMVASSVTFMADILVTLFATLAIFAMERFVIYVRWRDTLAFGVWSGLTILTKANGLFLALIPLCMIMSFRKYGLLKTWKFWSSALVVIAICAPNFIFTMRMSLNIGGNAGDSTYHYFGFNADIVLNQLFQLLGWAGSSFVLLGIGSLYWPSSAMGELNDLQRVTRMAIAWLAAVFLFLLFSPVVGEARMWLPVMPAIVVLVGKAIHSFVESLAASWVWIKNSIAFSILVLICFVTRYDIVPQPVSGYFEVARLATNTSDAQVILISSDSIGEGAYIVEHRLLDPKRMQYVVRASKVLANDSWSGMDYKLRLETAEEVRKYLHQLPVHIIVIDDPEYRGQKQDKHHDLLLKAMTSAPDDFVEIGVFPVSYGPVHSHSAIRVFENRKARGRHATTIETDMSYMLKKHIRHEVPVKK